MAPHISIVTTLYKSASYIEVFTERTIQAVAKINATYEIVFVNDGPTDNSPEIVRRLQTRNPNIKFIELSRNFGHHNAIIAGLEHSRGDLVFLIDSDLEEAPEDVITFHAELKAHADTDAIYGFQETRKGKIFERFSGWIFYTILQWLSEVPIQRNLATSRLMTRQYVDALLAFSEREFMFGGLVELVGFRSLGRPVTKLDKGVSSYTLKKKIDLFVNAITSMSAKPLWLIFKSGIAITMIAFIAFCIILVRHFIGGPSVIGWPSLILSIWLIGGITISFLGIIAVYLSKVFSEVKGRPRYIVKSVSQNTADPS